MKLKAFLMLAPILALSCGAMAQSEKMLKGKAITESALIDALTPPAAAPAAVAAPAADAEADVSATRSIKMVRDTPKPVAPPAAPKPPAKPASASLAITFETNSAVLTESAKRALDVVANALSSEKLGTFKFSIQGHADPRGNSDKNLKLSQLRADSVRQYLVQTRNISESRLEAVGKGDSQLLFPDNPNAAENRRVTIVNMAQ